MTAPAFSLGDAVRVTLPAFPAEIDLLPGSLRAMYDGQVGWVADAPRAGFVRVGFDDEHLAPGEWPTAELSRVCETCRHDLRDDDAESWPYCPRCRFVVRSHSDYALYGRLPWVVVELPSGRVVSRHGEHPAAESAARYLNDPERRIVEA